MKKNRFGVLIALLLTGALFAQTPSAEKTVSLKNYCPIFRGQKGATCFTYAPVYTAFSMMKNIETKAASDADKKANAFSDMYVASCLNKTNGYWTRTTSCCGKNGNYLKSLEFLKVFGTCRYDQFADKCIKCNSKLKKVKVENRFKIKGYEVFEDASRFIYSNNGMAKNFTSKGWVIDKLNDSIPVIVAYHQVDSFRDLQQEYWTPSEKEKSIVKGNCVSNHVVCIVGYKTDTEGNTWFEIRNNYLDWGKDNFAYVKAEDFLQFAEELAVIQLN